MVKIHGNYCGPNWTGGQPLAASDPNVDWTVIPVDRLDNACRNHDLSCAHPDGCSAAADRKLAAEATLNAILNPPQKDISLAIASLMSIAQLTRSR